METQYFDFEGNFGSQDPALQLTPADTAAFSRHFQEQKRLRAAEAAELSTKISSAPVMLDVDYVGSQDPADQPTAEDFIRLSAYLKAQRPHNEKLIAEARRNARQQAEKP